MDAEMIDRMVCGLVRHVEEEHENKDPLMHQRSGWSFEGPAEGQLWSSELLRSLLCGCFTYLSFQASAVLHFPAKGSRTEDIKTIGVNVQQARRYRDAFTVQSTVLIADGLIHWRLCCCPWFCSTLVQSALCDRCGTFSTTTIIISTDCPSCWYLQNALRSRKIISVQGETIDMEQTDKAIAY